MGAHDAPAEPLRVVVIGQRIPRQTERQKREAYEAATARDKGRCVRCGTNATTHRDHRQNRTAYNTTPANLQLLCALDCHPWKTHFPEWAMRDGFSVSRFAVDPAMVPAYRFDAGWVLYLDEPDEDGNWWRKVDEPNA